MQCPTRRQLVALTLTMPLGLAKLAAAQFIHPDLESLMTRMAAVTERRALFREERRIAALSQPLISTGSLHYRRPGWLEKRTESPVVERFLVDGDKVVLDTAEEGRRSFDLGQAPELRALVDSVRAPLAGDLDALRRGFQVSFTGTLAEWQLDLEPLDDQVGRLLRRASLAGSGDQLQEMLSVQANGDAFAMRIRQLT